MKTVTLRHFSAFWAPRGTHPFFRRDLRDASGHQGIKASSHHIAADAHIVDLKHDISQHQNAQNLRKFVRTLATTARPVSMHFAAPTFARTTPAKTRTTPANPRKRPQIPKSPVWGIGISIFLQISLWRGQFNKLVGGYFNRSALGDAEASPKLGTQCTNAWASPEFSENRVGCRLIRMFNRMRASAGVSAQALAGKGARGKRNLARLDFLKLA